MFHATEQFQEKVISYQQFSENPSVIDDPNLVVKIGNKYVLLDYQIINNKGLEHKIPYYNNWLQLWPFKAIGRIFCAYSAPCRLLQVLQLEHRRSCHVGHAGLSKTITTGTDWFILLTFQWLFYTLNYYLTSYVISLHSLIIYCVYILFKLFHKISSAYFIVVLYMCIVL